MGRLGASIPVYYNMHSEQLDGELHTLANKRNDPTLGIVIGVLLSIVCIVACIWFIIWHRRHLKRHSRQSNDTARSVISPNASCSPVVKPEDTFDQHEMETLIRKPLDTTHLHVLDRMTMQTAHDSGVTQLMQRLNGHHPDTREDIRLAAVGIDSGKGCDDTGCKRGEGSSDGRYGFIFSSTPRREQSDEATVPVVVVTTSSEDIDKESPRLAAMARNNNLATSTPKKPPRNGLLVHDTKVNMGTRK